MTRRAMVALLVLACAFAAPAGAQLSPPTEEPSTPRTGTPGLDEPVNPPTRSAVDVRDGVSQRDVGPILPGAVDAATYVLGPGDLLTLQMWGAITRLMPLEVGPEGTVLLPGAGSLKVDGRTLADVRRDLLDRLRARFRGVNMDLRLARPRTFRVYFTGEVRVPGPVMANGASRVGDVLSPERLFDHSSRRRIEVIRRSGERTIADLELFLRTGDQHANPLLQDGDVIHVPVASEFIYAHGAVAKPGRIELGMKDSLRTLLRLAGDPLPSAEAGRALYLHFDTDPFRPESAWVALGDIYRGFANYPLQDGARLYVQYIPEYRSQHEATVLGEVSRPGSYPIVEGRTRLSHLLDAAEGFLSSANLSALRVHRTNPAAAERDPELERLLQLSRNELTASEYEVLRTKLAARAEDYRVDWTRLQAEKALDLLLRDGDVVRVERLIPSIRVDGEVRRPGIVNFVQGQRLDDYVRQSGGYTDRAWQGKVRVTRAVSGQTLLARNVQTLDPGDFVWVPEKPDVTIWEQAKDVLTALATVATIVIAIRSID